MSDNISECMIPSHDQVFVCFMSTSAHRATLETIQNGKQKKQQKTLTRWLTWQLQAERWANKSKVTWTQKHFPLTLSEHLESWLFT